MERERERERERKREKYTHTYMYICRYNIYAHAVYIREGVEERRGQKG